MKQLFWCRAGRRSSFLYLWDQFSWSPNPVRPVAVSGAWRSSLSAQMYRKIAQLFWSLVFTQTGAGDRLGRVIRHRFFPPVTLMLILGLAGWWEYRAQRFSEGDCNLLGAESDASRRIVAISVDTLMSRQSCVDSGVSTRRELNITCQPKIYQHYVVWIPR